MAKTLSLSNRRFHMVADIKKKSCTEKKWINQLFLNTDT